ncbi:hypothetical protein [Streptomyces sp. NPDC059979]|uniref:hypothetical protein n=1 Tax=Streptomyces sp. NPDC059979 TaxID=3347021 RepID=UPI0036967C08
MTEVVPHLAEVEADTAIPEMPAAAALRPLQPPPAAMATAAAHHSLVCSAASSTGDRSRRAQAESHAAIRRVSL